MENMEICWQDTRIAQTFGWMTMRMKFVHYIVPNPLQIWNLRCRWLQGASTIIHKTVQTWIQPNHGLKHLDDMLVVLWLMHDLKAKDSAGFGIAHHKPTVGFLANSDGGFASSACTFVWCVHIWPSDEGIHLQPLWWPWIDWMERNGKRDRKPHKAPNYVCLEVHLQWQCAYANPMVWALAWQGSRRCHCNAIPWSGLECVHHHWWKQSCMHGQQHEKTSAHERAAPNGIEGMEGWSLSLRWRKEHCPSSPQRTEHWSSCPAPSDSCTQSKYGMTEQSIAFAHEELSWDHSYHTK